jgi:hypothetical protein
MTALPVGAQSASGTIQITCVLAAVEKTIDTTKAKPSDLFRAKTIQGTELNDGTTVPTGSVLEGHVVSATPFDHQHDGMPVLTID